MQLQITNQTTFLNIKFVLKNMENFEHSNRTYMALIHTVRYSNYGRTVLKGALQANGRFTETVADDAVLCCYCPRLVMDYLEAVSSYKVI